MERDRRGYQALASDHEMDSHRRNLSRDRTRIIVIVKSAITEIFPASEYLTLNVESRYKFANLIRKDLILVRGD